MISLPRILNEFSTLVSFDSESFSERQTADWLKIELTKLGFRVEEDKASIVYSGNAGNLYGFLKGTIPGDPLLLSAHMDVVHPGRDKKPVFYDDGTITSDGTTVLGADDICGITEILEGIRHVIEEGLPRRDIEILFTIGEEAHCRGAAVFDYSKIRAREAYIPDLSGPVGTAAVAAPTISTFELTLKGKAAHAGFEPEKGIHAIKAMANLIQTLPIGKPDSFTTMNVGAIHGGSSSNIVPPECYCYGEIRSIDHERVLAQIENLKYLIHDTEERCGVNSDLSIEFLLHAYRTPSGAPVVKRFEEVCGEMNLTGNLIETFGGSDNNHFAANGITGIVLSCGMYNVHSVNEYTRQEDLEKGAELFARLISRP